MCVSAEFDRFFRPFYFRGRLESKQIGRWKRKRLCPPISLRTVCYAAAKLSVFSLFSRCRPFPFWRIALLNVSCSFLLWKKTKGRNGLRFTTTWLKVARRQCRKKRRRLSSRLPLRFLCRARFHADTYTRRLNAGERTGEATREGEKSLPQLSKPRTEVFILFPHLLYPLVFQKEKKNYRDSLTKQCVHTHTIWRVYI